jgi:hypothetical protein
MVDAGATGVEDVSRSARTRRPTKEISWPPSEWQATCGLQAEPRTVHLRGLSQLNGPTVD